MKKPPIVTEQHSSDTQYITDAIEPGACYKLNLADDRQYQFQKQMYLMNDYTPERYPQLFKQLEKAREHDVSEQKTGGPELDQQMLQNGDSGFKSLNELTSLGSHGATGSETVAATGYSTIIGGSSNTTLILQVYDYTGGSNGALLAQNSVIKFQNGKYVGIEAVGTDAPTSQMHALLNYSYTPLTGTNKGTPQTGIVKLHFQDDVTQDPSLSAPVQKPENSGNPHIDIALGRGAWPRNTDVDYWFNKDLSLSANTVIVPFAGHVTFNSAIKTPLSDNLIVNVTIALKDGGSSKTPTDPGAISSAFSIEADGTTLKWSLVPGADGAFGNPINFGSAPALSNNKVTYFNCSIAVTTEDDSSGAFSWAYVRSSDSADTNELDGIKYIKPIEFMMHCLAPGSLVTLADGSTVPIEEIDNSHEVKIDNVGGVMAVRATSHSPAREGELLRLTTDKGHSVTLSDGHVMMTPQGPKRAEELKAGDSTIVLDGEAIIASIEQAEVPAGDLINLHLGAPEDRATLPEFGTTFFADGFLVGDYQIQSRYEDWLLTQRDYVLKHLPEEWHTDYLSSLEDSA